MSQREILFKAKHTKDREWVFGSYVTYKSLHDGNIEHRIIDNIGDVFVVDPETVCEYTGLTDKNGKKIFENDILRIAKKSDGMGGYCFPPLEYPVNVSVKFDLCAYMWETIGDEKYYISFPDAWCHYECEVIGNIHDN